MADLEVAVTSIDVSKIPSCFWGCGFRKAGFLNDEGQYDVETGVSNLKRFMGDPTALEMLEKVARQCNSVKDKPVSDGKAGCEMGKLAAACFLEQMKEMKMSK
uniref:Odorant binding protein n=1 Tax=Athetis dissimilis TaxID=1737331 RepID=A0A4D6QBH2_ATHDI|nr:odorant binding protein [Athetis dissimilis]